MDDQNAQLNAQVADLKQQLAISAPTDATGPLQVENVVSLDAGTADIVARGLATIVIDSAGTHLIIQAEQLPALQNEEAFQVWLLKDGQPASAGTFLTHDGTGALYHTIAAAESEYDTIAITLEPDAQGNEPRGPIVLSAPLTSA
ncbi:anti-sigma factor [Paenibacillus sp. IB182496]|uniref:Anti-sigma factor n=2 Tax=Paenibacillus sabuli TaxID=2772509 RepID=A0A927BRR2_9BACL|nr:anti-sigma factor [Paenibacillus sabuli]